MAPRYRLLPSGPPDNRRSAALIILTWLSITPSGGVDDGGSKPVIVTVAGGIPRREGVVGVTTADAHLRGLDGAGEPQRLWVVGTPQPAARLPRRRSQEHSFTDGGRLVEPVRATPHGPAETARRRSAAAEDASADPSTTEDTAASGVRGRAPVRRPWRRGRAPTPRPACDPGDAPPGHRALQPDAVVSNRIDDRPGPSLDSAVALSTGGLHRPGSLRSDIWIMCRRSRTVLSAPSRSALLTTEHRRSRGCRPWRPGCHRPAPAPRTTVVSARATTSTSRTPDAHRLDEHDVTPGRLHHPDRLSGGSGDTAEVTTRGHQAEEDSGVGRVLLHADPVTEQGRHRRRVRRVDGEHAHDPTTGPQFAHGHSSWSTCRPQGAGQADDMGVPVALGEAGEDVARSVVWACSIKEIPQATPRTPALICSTRAGDVDDAGSAAAQGSCRLTRRPMGRALGPWRVRG